MPHLYVGRWQVQARDMSRNIMGGTLVLPHFADGPTNALALGPKIPGNPVICCYPTPQPNSSFDVYLGEYRPGNDPDLRLAQRQALPVAVSETRLSNVIEELLVNKGDPTGVSSWMPVISSSRDGYGAYIGHRIKIPFHHPELRLPTKILKFQAGYRRKMGLAQNQKDLDRIRKWAGAFGIKERLYANPGAFLPPEYLSNGLLPPATTIDTDFTADAIGTEWIEDVDASAWSIGGSPTELQDILTAGEPREFARWAGSPLLSNEDHQAEVKLTNNGAAYEMTVVCRKNGADEDGYGGGHASISSNYVIVEFFAGTPPSVSVIGNAGTKADGAYYKLVVADSDQELFSDATQGSTTSRVTATDPTKDNLGYTDVGVYGKSNFGTLHYGANYQASDAGGGATAWGPLLGLQNNRLVMGV